MSSETAANSALSILRAKGVNVVGVLVACFLFQGFVNYGLGKTLFENYEKQAKRDSLTISNKDKEIDFFKKFIIDDSKDTRSEMKELRDRNTTLLDSLVRFTNQKNEKR